MPAGFTAGGLPVGLEFVALEHHERRLLRLAYDFERVTRHRRPPAPDAAVAPGTVHAEN